MKNSDVYLWDMAKAARKILAYTEGRAEDDLNRDSMFFDAVIREFQVLGEAARKMSDDERKKYPLPWKKIIGFRTIIIHQYDDIQTETVWKTVKEDIPLVLNAVEQDVQRIEERVQSEHFEE